MTVLREEEEGGDQGAARSRAARSGAAAAVRRRRRGGGGRRARKSTHQASFSSISSSRSGPSAASTASPSQRPASAAFSAIFAPRKSGARGRPGRWAGTAGAGARGRDQARRHARWVGECRALKFESERPAQAAKMGAAAESRGVERGGGFRSGTRVAGAPPKSTGAARRARRLARAPLPKATPRAAHTELHHLSSGAAVEHIHLTPCIHGQGSRGGGGAAGARAQPIRPSSTQRPWNPCGIR